MRRMRDIAAVFVVHFMSKPKKVHCSSILQYLILSFCCGVSRQLHMHVGLAFDPMALSLDRQFVMRLRRLR